MSSPQLTRSYHRGPLARSALSLIVVGLVGGVILPACTTKENTPAGLPTSGVVVDQAPTEVYAGQTVQFKAHFTGIEDHRIGYFLGNCFDTSDAFVSVDGLTGVVTARVPVDTDAVATVVCMLGAGTSSDVRQTRDLTVRSRIQSVASSPQTLTLNVNQTSKLAPSWVIVPGSPSTPTPVPTYKSANPTLVDVDAQGNVKGLASTNGSAVNVTIRVEGIKATVPVIVNPAPPAPVATSITLLVNTGTATRAVIAGGETVNIGSTLTLVATVRDQTGAALAEAATWTSSNPSVATVDAATGVVTAKASGSATITAASPSKPSVTNAVAVTVPPPAGGTATSITIAPTSATLKVGSQQQFTATLRDASGNPTAPPAGGVIAYAVDASAIATVSAGGLVQAFSAGTTTVRAFLVVNGQSTNLAAAATLTVTP